jgi:DNA-directed RNA polymerase subunit RPC12/RpoP
MTSARFYMQPPERGFVYCPWCGKEIFREEMSCPYCGHEPWEPTSECRCKYCRRLIKEWHAQRRQQTYIRHSPWSYAWPRSVQKKNRHN